MSVDTGLVIRKQKMGWAFFEINLSTLDRSYLETLWKKGHTEKDVEVKIEELDNKLAKECGAYYEGIFHEDSIHERKKTHNAIRKIKEETREQLEHIISKIVHIKTKKGNYE